jgi:hypothetical protein
MSKDRQIEVQCVAQPKEGMMQVFADTAAAPQSSTSPIDRHSWKNIWTTGGLLELPEGEPNYIAGDEVGKSFRSVVQAFGI